MALVLTSRKILKNVMHVGVRVFVLTFGYVCVPACRVQKTILGAIPLTLYAFETT